MSNEAPVQNPSRRSFIKYAAAGVAAAAIAGAIGGGYYEYVYVPNSRPKSVSVGWVTGPYVPKVVVDVVEQQKMDQQNGLNITWVTFNDVTTQLAALIKGSVDVIIGNFGNIAAANAAGNPIVGFDGWLTSTNAIVASNNSSAKSFQDLKGKTIGVFSTPSTTMAVGAALLKQQGVSFDPGTDVSYERGPYPTLYGDMLAGKLHYAELVEPFITELTSTGNFRTVATLTNLATDLFGGSIYIDMWASMQSYANQNADVLRKIQKTYQDGSQYVVANPSVIQNYLENVSKITDQSVLTPLVPRLVDNLKVGTWNSAAISREQQLLQVFFDYGLINKLPQNFLTNSYNP